MGVRAVLTTKALHAEPGGQAVATITIRNTGTVVDHFNVTVVGVPAPWATVTPATLPLFPDAEGVVTVTFHPPQLASVPAGQIPFGIGVRSEVDPMAATVEEGTLEVGSFTQFHADLSPEISHGRRVGRHQLACDNFGNAPLALSFEGSDPENALQFDFRPERPVIQPGTAMIVRMRARPREGKFMGASKTHRFRITVKPSTGDLAYCDGQMVQSPRVPVGLLVAFGALLALVAVAAVVFIALRNPSASNSLAGAPTNTPGGSATPTPGTSPTPTAVPPVATNGQIASVAANTYPPCVSSTCTGNGAQFTTCDSGMSAASSGGGNAFSHCPFSTRLQTQLAADSQSSGGHGDPVGGGQDPEWTDESVTTNVTSTGGTAHVVLTFGSTTAKTDLIIVWSGKDFVVDDIACTGQDPSNDAYSSGWNNGAGCSTTAPSATPPTHTFTFFPIITLPAKT